jgi:hypothetical protein
LCQNLQRFGMRRDERELLEVSLTGQLHPRRVTGTMFMRPVSCMVLRGFP